MTLQAMSGRDFSKVRAAKREAKGIWIPMEIYILEDLSWQEKLLLVEVDSLDNDTTGCFASNKYFSDFLGVSESRIANLISGLIQKKYLETRDFDGRKRKLRTCFYRSTRPYANDQGSLLVTQGSPQVNAVVTSSEHINRDINRDINKSYIEQARRVFEEWQKVLEHPNAKFDEKRQKRIVKLLKSGFTEQELLKVPHGVKKSPFHMGENPTKTKYDKIDTVFRDADRVEYFIELSKKKAVANIPVVSSCILCDTYNSAPGKYPPCKFHQKNLKQKVEKNEQKDLSNSS